MIRNTPLAAHGEKLNYDIGIYAQDSWTLKRLTLNAGLRFEKLKAPVLAATAPAGRFVPERTFAAIENLPNWTGDFAPRFAAVCDVFGNAKTALKYTLNKYNLARTLPFRRQFKLAGSYPLMYGITISGSWQNVQGSTSTTNMAITRGSTRYPANCPAPCPAGAVILPSTFQPATFTLQLVDQDIVYTERINQLDLKVQKTFRRGRMIVSPVFEAFNVTNSDAVVSSVSTSVLNTAYLRPNSILQGRILGVGATVRW